MFRSGASSDLYRDVARQLLVIVIVAVARPFVSVRQDDDAVRDASSVDRRQQQRRVRAEIDAIDGDKHR